MRSFTLLLTGDKNGLVGPDGHFFDQDPTHYERLRVVDYGEVEALKAKLAEARRVREETLSEAMKQCTALRAENKALKANAVLLYNLGYHAGHHNTVESQYTDIVVSDMQTFHSDVVAEIVAALAAKGE